MRNSQELANIIKEVAKSKKIGIGKMLSDCGLSVNTLSSMQSGGYFPRLEALAKIADYLDCSVDYLLGRTDSISETGEFDVLTLTPGTTKMQKMLVFNMEGIPGGHEVEIPDDAEVLNEINKLVKILSRCPLDQVTALKEMVENGGNIPLKADLPPDLKELLRAAANLSPEKIKTLIQVAEGMK